MTGHWPYKSPGPFDSVEEKCRYDDKVDELFRQGKFPAVLDLAGGGVIQSCWNGEYMDIEALVRDQVQAEGLVVDLHTTEYMK